jgi:hypothetical protein
VAGHYVPDGMITINGGDAAPIAEVAQAFIAAFPDIEVFMDDLVLREDGIIEYRWTFTGTSAETGKSVRVLRGVDDRPGRPDRRVTRSLRPSRVRPPGRARHRPGHLADLR